jgi:uncharacterized membrane protein
MELSSEAARRTRQPGRRDAGFRRRLGVAVRWGCQHWLPTANLALLVFSILPVLAPILVTLGANDLALTIYRGYSLTCHQMPSRSYFIFGQQMADCERNTAIYCAMAGTGLAFAATGRRWRPVSWRGYAALILPMAIDGFTQLSGWRESTWLLRSITGALFGGATVWRAYPMLRDSFAEIDAVLASMADEETETAAWYPST